jgi:hypothetical protein
MTPDHANNGNPSDAWHSRFYDYNIWFRLDWSQAQSISRIYINHNPWYWLGQTVSSIRYLSPSGVWSTIPVSFPIYSGYSTAPIVDVSFPPVEAVSLIVYMSPGPQNPHPNWAVFISEIEVYGGASLKIVAPSDNSVFDRGQPITFLGEKTGNVTNIQWSSDLAGLIGTSFPSIATSGLRVGTHTITLSGIVGGPVASIKSEVSPSIRGLAPGSPVSHSIKIQVKGGRPRLTKLEFQPMTGQNNQNKIYDRVGIFRKRTLLEPIQWQGKTEGNEVVEDFSYPISYVRSNAESVGEDSSKVRIKATFIDLDSSPALTFKVQLTNLAGYTNLNFPDQIVKTNGNSEATAIFESSNGLPAEVGIGDLRLLWSFSHNGAGLGDQTTNQSILTTWEKPIEKQDFSANIPEADPVTYYEIQQLSSEILSDFGSAKTESEIVTELMNKYSTLGGFQYSDVIYTPKDPRGLDAILSQPTLPRKGWCGELGLLLKALCESQGLDVKLRHYRLKTAYLGGYALFTPRPATDGVLPPKWRTVWEFKEHATVLTKDSPLVAFDPSFKVNGLFVDYVNSLFDVLKYEGKNIGDDPTWPDPIPEFVGAQPPSPPSYSDIN